MSWRGTIHSGCIVWGFLADLLGAEHIDAESVSDQSFPWVVIR